MRSVGWVLAVVLTAGLLWWVSDATVDSVVPDGVGAQTPGPEAPGLEGRGEPELVAAVADEDGAARATGHVVDEQGVPQPGVRVSVRRLPRRQGQDWHARLVRWVHRTRTDALPFREVSSDADGAFRFTGLPRDGWLRFEAHPGPPRVGATLELPVRNLRGQALVLVVEPGVALSGQVVDAAGAGVVAEIEAKTRTGPLRDQYAGGKLVLGGIRTDADGRFRIGALPAGVAELSVHVAGRVRRPFLVAVPSTDVVLRMFEAGGVRIHGHVKTPDGDPIPAAQVVAQLTETRTGHPFYGIAESDAAGHYVMDDLPPAALGKIMAVVPRYRPGFYGGGGREVEHGANVEADIVLVPGAALTGRVQSESGEPVPGLAVFVRESTMQSHRVRTDADGAFVIEDLVPGETVELAGWGSEWYLPDQDGGRITGRGSGSLRVAVEADGSPIVLVALRGLALEIDVETASGDPAGGARIELMPYGSAASFGYSELARADADGRCRVAIAPTVQHDIRVRLADEIARVGPLVWEGAPEAPVRVVLQPALSISGRVEDGRGVPVADLSVSAADHDSRQSHGTCRTGPDGRFAFRDLVAGRYRIRVKGSTVREDSVPEATLELGVGEHRDDLVFVVPSVAVLSGSVVRADGAPATLKPLMVIDSSMRMLVANTTTDGEGRFAAVVAEGGEYGLIVGGVSVDGTWRPGEGQRVVVDDPAARKVKVRIVDPEGNLVPHVHVTLESLSDGSTGSYPREVDGGELVVGRPQAGWTLVIKVRSPKDAQGNPLNLLAATRGLPDTDDVLEIELPRGRTLSGRVLGNGAPLGGVSVRAGPPRSHERTSLPATTDDDGRFTLVAVVNAQVQLYVTAPAGYLPLPDRLVEIDEDDIEVRLTSGTERFVRVLGPDRAPVVDQIVKAWGKHEGAHWSRESRTDADGRARITATPGSGSMQLIVDPTAAGFPKVWLRDVALGPDEVVVNLLPGAYIEGVLVDADGKVPPGAHVRLMGATDDLRWIHTSVAADPETGVFRLGPVTAGLYTVWAGAGRGYTDSAYVDVAAPAHELRLTVPRRAAIRGQIQTDQRAGWSVRFVLTRSVWYGEIAADGKFEIDDLRDEVGAIYASSGVRYALVENVRPSDGPFELRPEDGTTVTGDVPSGTDEEDVAVGLERGALQLYPPGIERGRFEIRGVPPGEWTLFLRKGETHILRRAIQVPSGADTIHVSFDK